jgi:NADH-quinone oxidoreductase subunit L
VQDFLHWTWLLPLIMATSFALILFFGKRMPKGGSEIGIAAVGICLILAVVSAGGWAQHVNDAKGKPPTVAEAASNPDEAQAQTAKEAEEPVQPIETSVTWFEVGDQKVEVGTLVDGLSVMMMLVVTIISLLVHIYSTDYVADDRRYTHYFAFLSLFTGSMLMLVMSSNTIQFITSWELVGVCSFALIGHWWEEKPNSDAALKAFIVNRVGDVGLLVGMITLFWATGTFNILQIDTLANGGGIEHLLLQVASLCLLAAVMSKSGQFILHVWLPDAMAGPTPVSALIHAATMVVAGIFMVARLYSVFWSGLVIGNSHINALAVVGAVTVVGGAGLAFVQNDIKKVLAYSTVSQLGYMVMALGVGAWTAALFHLFTHAFFKAGLFLGSGSVAHSVHSFDMKKDMGGLKRFMPKTFWTFAVCTLALVGVFPLAGFWSKDEILAGAHGAGGLPGYQLMLVAGILGALMTAAYMTRCVYLTFWGEPRGAAADPHHPPHESGPRIVVPLYILSGLAVVAGLANFPFAILGDGYKVRFEHYVEPVGAYFPTLPHPVFTPWIAGVSLLMAALGIGLSLAYYYRGLFQGAVDRYRLARWGHTVLVNKYYFDAVYVGGVARGVSGPIAKAAYWFDQHIINAFIDGVGVGSRMVADWVYGNIDQTVIDGAVNGSGLGAEESGQILRRLQSGKVQQYGALLFGGAVILAAVLVFAV